MEQLSRKEECRKNVDMAGMGWDILWGADIREKKTFCNYGDALWGLDGVDMTGENEIPFPQRWSPWACRESQCGQMSEKMQHQNVLGSSSS